MTTHSSEFVQAVATLAAKAAVHSDWSVTQCVEFAWFSVGQDGDATVDSDDFDRHFADFKVELANMEDEG